MRSRSRVVVTGMGAVTPIGVGVGAFWERCVQGTSGVQRIREFPIPEGRSAIAGIVDGFDAPAGVDRSLAFALAAGREATRAAGIEAPKSAAEADARSVHISTAIAQIGEMEREFVRQSKGRRDPIGAVPAAPSAAAGDARALRAFQFNTVASALHAELGFSGGCTTIPTGCTGGLDAIGYAMQAIRDGEADLVVTGATEAPITPLVVAAFGMIGATSLRNAEPERASRPFDVDRDGFVLAEGCALLVLESLEHARARGATILAEVAGYGSVNNCYHMTDIPEAGEQIAESAVRALADAGVSADRIDAINAHGSSTPQNDVAETQAYHRLFGPRAERIPVTSIKSQIGHPLSASNAIEVVSVVQSLVTGIVPPTINHDRRDPRCALDVVGNVARETRPTCVLKTSSGFSGIHSSLVIRKWEG
ncbi:beta-ketoacyl-[acyl-carrier-protein] synthase family protein [Sorangium sp. So ce119]|uniref:beta-ketoacyl-[acyl-carrier-protein] synthase family protein n=1 Tax=Sorangium sp. So ce119 TaxID=3133279 RepID=UPI003F613829